MIASENVSINTFPLYLSEIYDFSRRGSLSTLPPIVKAAHSPEAVRHSRTIKIMTFQGVVSSPASVMDGI